ncbi:hypothetical protein ACFC09_09725 [Streptomyces sp. NPDC056161]|uniref:hypothetical protein n=1 Tax=Streptomyces sp. NPDC056161 TaxID=3345732 RepID=UPI0035E03789
MFYEPASAAWRIGAESPHRSPVLYAVGEMTQTVRARGGEPVVALWGPRDGAWHRAERSAAPPGAVPSPVLTGPSPAEPVDRAGSPDPAALAHPAPAAAGAGAGAAAGAAADDVGEASERVEPQSKLAERMDDRRHQVLMAGLGKAGLYDLAQDDLTAVQTLVDRLDETTLRRVAHWLATAGGEG